MKLLFSVLTGLHLLARSTASHAASHALTPRFPCGGSGCTPPQTEQAIQNASLVLGWQLAGVMRHRRQVYDACRDIGTISHGKWYEVGVDGYGVQSTFPSLLCRRVSAGRL